jgi:acetyl esterase/lipase
MEADKVIPFKTFDSGKVLNLHVFNPQGHTPAGNRPAIVFFFGGSWVGGTPQQFYPQARAFADHGLVAMSAEYRTRITPFECVEDGKSAIRWVRQHAGDLGLDPDRIVAAGGSAGGHVALCAGMIEGHEDKGEDLSISSLPNAMILYNPVVDTSETGFGMTQVGAARKTEISPCHHVRKGIAPTLIFHGTSDSTVPFENVERFTRLMKKAGNVCMLVPFDKRDHAFFNSSAFLPTNREDDFNKTMEESVTFLTTLGFLSPIEQRPQSGA